MPDSMCHTGGGASLGCYRAMVPGLGYQARVGDARVGCQSICVAQAYSARRAVVPVVSGWEVSEGRQ